MLTKIKKFSLPFQVSSSYSSYHIIVTVIFHLFILINLVPQTLTASRPAASVPSVNETSQEPVLVSPGDDAYIDCKVNNLESYTVLWKSVNPTKDADNGILLTAGRVRVTSDKRFSIIHHAGNGI